MGPDPPARHARSSADIYPRFQLITTLGQPKRYFSNRGAATGGMQIRIGLCSPPIETREGWLMTYHGGARHGRRSDLSRGLALLDLGRSDARHQARR